MRELAGQELEEAVELVRIAPHGRGQRGRVDVVHPLDGADVQLQAVAEERPVRQAGQAVELRQARHVLLGVPPFADVAHEAEELRLVGFGEAWIEISTGVFRFPADLAARIAVGTVVSEISTNVREIDRVVFCCFSQESADYHINAFAELGLD